MLKEDIWKQTIYRDKQRLDLYQWQENGPTIYRRICEAQLSEKPVQIALLGFLRTLWSSVLPSLNCFLSAKAKLVWLQGNSTANCAVCCHLYGLFGTSLEMTVCDLWIKPATYRFFLKKCENSAYLQTLKWVKTQNKPLSYLITDSIVVTWIKNHLLWTKSFIDI